MRRVNCFRRSAQMPMPSFPALNRFGFREHPSEAENVGEMTSMLPSFRWLGALADTAKHVPMVQLAAAIVAVFASICSDIKP